MLLVFRMLQKRARSNPLLEDRKRLSLWWHYSSRAAKKGELRRSNCVKRSNLPKIWPLFCLFCLLTKVKGYDIIGGPCAGRNFYYTISRTFCQGKIEKNFAQIFSQNESKFCYICTKKHKIFFCAFFTKFTLSVCEKFRLVFYKKICYNFIVRLKEIKFWEYSWLRTQKIKNFLKPIDKIKILCYNKYVR